MENGKVVEFLMRKDSDETINYRKAENAEMLIGKFVEIEYEEFSDGGIPTKPTGVRLREMVEGTWEPRE